MELTTLALLFVSITQSANLPKGLMSALCYVESNHKVYAMHKDDGGSDSLGICEIKLETARLMGFKGTQNELMMPHTNIKYAGKYLSKQMSRYRGDIRKAVAAYNAGSYREGKNHKPINDLYVRKVFKAWAENR